MNVSMTVNGEQVSRDVEPRQLLVHFIRETLGLKGTHWGCDTSNCGACVVLMDGQPVKSCTALAVMCDGHEIRTVESLEVDGELDPIQQGFHERHALQCGFCTPGMLMTARALLDENPDPTDHEIRTAISGAICRCTGYKNIVSAVRWAAEHEASAKAGGMSMAVVENLPSPSTERPIGFGRLKRKEDARFIRGQGTYLDDIELPGMVHGAVLRSPYAHARIVSIDTSAALAHPNVAAVVTAKDLETLGLAWMPTISYDTQAVLAGDKVRFQGQEVAFVIATDEYSANDALCADRRRVRAAAGGRQRAQGARPRRAADPRRQVRPARQPREPDLGGRRRGGDRRAPSPRPTRSSAATSSTRAATRRRSRRAGSSPTSTRRPASSTSTTATRRRTPTARSTRTSPGSPST